jgi:hypothetical protein
VGTSGEYCSSSQIRPAWMAVVVANAAGDMRSRGNGGVAGR